MGLRFHYSIINRKNESIIYFNADKFELMYF